MKGTILTLSALVIGTAALAQSATKTETTPSKKGVVSESSTYKFFDSKNLQLDLKIIDPAKGSFGIDYDFQLDKKLEETTDKKKYRLINFSVGSKGFVTVAGDKNQNNSMISEFKFEGFPLVMVRGKEGAPVVEADSPENPDPKLDPLKNESSERAAQVYSPFWFNVNLHAKHETTQDFRNYDFAIGPEISLSTSYLSAILDYPFGLFRAGENNNPRQLQMSVGYDYVTGVNRTSLAPLLGEDKFMNRLNLKAEWETGIISGKERIAFLIDSYYDLDKRLLLKNAGKAWNYFYMIRLERRININLGEKAVTKIAVKYTQGELPPNFDKGFVLGGGFSIDF